MLLATLGWFRDQLAIRFNGHPPLGVNATGLVFYAYTDHTRVFQRAPTLGGECYMMDFSATLLGRKDEFQWAPTLGGECYGTSPAIRKR